MALDMTETEFLAVPLRHWYSKQQSEVQTEWFAEAWRTSPKFKSEIFYELKRYASKLGQFLADETFVHLSQFLTEQEVLELHRYILENAGREPDWRGEFEKWFPQFEDVLPPIRFND